jgi:hypothetical protein
VKVFKSRRGVIWVIYMVFCLLGVIALLVGSYFYLGLHAKKLQDRISSPDVDSEKSIFLPVLLKKQMGKGIVADALVDAEKSNDYSLVKNEINEYLFVRFKTSVEWNLYVNNVERVDNQLTGFVVGRKFSAYIPLEKEPFLMNVTLEVNNDAWDGELSAPFVGGLT